MDKEVDEIGLGCVTGFCAPNVGRHQYNRPYSSDTLGALFR
jgi:hypothetical protein